MHKIFLFLMLFVYLATGCSPSSATFPATTVAPVRASDVVITRTTQVPLATATQTPQSPAVHPVDSATPLIEPTSTLISTLRPELAISQLENLIQNPGECRLPCWWGITPGKSSVEDLQSVIVLYAPVLTFYGDGGEGFSFEIGQELTSDFYIQYELDAGQNTVKFIYVSSEASQAVDDGFKDVYDAQPYHQLLQAYSLPQVLANYGKPSNVLVNVNFYTYDGRPPQLDQQFGELTLRLFYPELGILAMYDMALIPEGETGRSCPADAFVKLRLTSPDPEGTRAPFIRNGEDYKEDKSIDEALQMNVEEFYELFHKTAGACVQTPLSIWTPTP